MPFGAVRNAPYRPLVGLGSASEYDPKQAADEQHPLMRSGCPSTHEATGSDPHRVCLTRLCCAFRLSQPPDASFLPRPARLCFTPVAPLGFSLQRFAPLTSPPEPLGLTAPPDVVPTKPAETRSLAWTMVAHGRMRNGPLFRGCGRALAPGTHPAPSEMGSSGCAASREGPKAPCASPLSKVVPEVGDGANVPSGPPKTRRSRWAARNVPNRPCASLRATDRATSRRLRRASRRHAPPTCGATRRADTANGARNAPDTIGRRLAEPSGGPAERCRRCGRRAVQPGCARPTRLRCRMRSGPATW
jgi:hypothetical protein